jgi:hypothetical protein
MSIKRNIMKRNIVLFGFFLAAALTPAAMGDTISALQTPLAKFSFGGEFTAITTPALQLGLAAPAGSGFQTFCLEPDIDFTPGASRNYTFAQSDHTGDPLTLGTAWLFSEFSSGSLTGYNYNLGVDRINSAKNLQAALWILQGETLPDPFLGLGSVFVGLATAATSGHQSDPSLGAYGVQILSLSDAQSGADSQDLIGVIPITPVTGNGVPDAGNTLSLLSFGLIGTMGLRAGISPRRFKSVSGKE